MGVRGGGAFLDGEPIRVSSVARLDDAYVSTTSLRAFPQFARSAAPVALARTYTDFWQYMLVAEGRIEAGCDPVMAPWDVVAPQLIVEEAGGRLTEDDRLWLATNGRSARRAQRIAPSSLSSASFRSSPPP